MLWIRKGCIERVKSECGLKFLLYVMILCSLVVSIASQNITSSAVDQLSLPQPTGIDSHSSQPDILNSVQQSLPICTFKCQQMKFYNCSICYNQCTYSNSTIVQLSTCQWSHCNWWQNFVYSDDNPTSTYTRCTDYQTVLLPVTKCIYQCCGNAGFETFTVDTMQQCVDANKVDQTTDSTVNIVIATSLSASFVLIIVTVIMCWCRHRVIVSINNFIYFFQNLCPCIGDNEETQKKQSTTDATRNGSSVRSRRKWVVLKKKGGDCAPVTEKEMVNSQSDINPQHYCSICLDDGLNCETSCLHRYHFQCLRTSLSKKTKCPQCSSTGYNPLKIICQFCKQKYTSFKLNNDNIDERHPEFFYDGKIYCNDCLQVHLTRSRRTHRRGNHLK